MAFGRNLFKMQSVCSPTEELKILMNVNPMERLLFCLCFLSLPVLPPGGLTGGLLMLGKPLHLPGANRGVCATSEQQTLNSSFKIMLRCTLQM